jgi:2,6-dihydroxypseudooxynicotine hydrolase
VSNTSSLKPEAEMLNWGRLILDGVEFADMIGARDRPDDVTWFEYWMDRADVYEKLGEDAAQHGHGLSAGRYLVTGALCAQYAQFLWFDEKRQQGQRRKAELYRKAAPLLSPPAERLEIEIAGLNVPVYIRRPQTPGPHPMVIMLGGLESTKEESYDMENLVLERGMATATFDGPGQGEMWEDRRIAGDYEVYTSAVMDALLEDPGFDSEAFVVFGRSLGGNYALKSAACDQRFAACVVWGGFTDMDYWEEETPLTKESWRYVSKVDTLEEAREHVHAALETRPVLGNITCPTYILHGAHDEVPLSYLDTLKQYVTNAEMTIVLEHDGDHCCHNLGVRPRLQMADWLQDLVVKNSTQGENE